MCKAALFLVLFGFDLIGLQHLHQGANRFLDDVRGEGILHMVAENQGTERIFSAGFAEFEIAFPSEFMVLAVQVEELEGHDLGQGVIDVIERDFEDMGLKQPAVARL